MGFYRKYGIVAALLFLIAGILTSRYFEILLFHLLISAALAIAGIVINRNSIIAVFFPLALLLCFNSWEKQSVPPEFVGNKVTISGTLTENPDKRQKSWKYTVNVTSISNGEKEYRTNQKIAVYSKQSVDNAYTGSRVTVYNAELEEIYGFKNPGSFNLKEHFSKKGIYYTSFIENPLHIQPQGRDKKSSYPLFRLNKFRKKYENFVRSTLPAPNNEIINAITVGVKGGVPEKTRNSFSKLGISHLLAISGLHTGALAVFIYFSIKWLLKRSGYLLLMYEVPKIASALTILPLFFYAGLAGFANPVLRAFIMITLYITAYLFNREEEKFNILAAAAVVILILSPKSLFELSFQLSFLAVGGIILFHRVYPFRFDTITNKLFSMIKTTVAASLFTLPLVINSFGFFPVATIPANLIAVPLVEFLIVPLGLVSIVIFPFSKTACEYLLEVIMKLMEILIYISDIILRLDFSYLTVPGIGPAGYSLFLLTVIFIIVNSYSQKFRYFAVFSFLLFSLTVVSGVDSNNSKGRLEFNFLDTGNKTYVLVVTPDENSILISGGYSYYSKSDFEEKAAVIPFLLENGITRLDHFFILSTDSSNLNGAAAIAKRINIRNLWTNGSRLEGKLWEIIRKEEINWKSTTDETKPLFFGNTELRFIKPFVKEDLWNSKRPRSQLLMFKNGYHKFLLGEGIHRRRVQKELLATYSDRIKADVVFIEKIENTGLNFKNMIEATGPEYMITNSTDVKIKDFDNLYELSRQGMVKIVSNNMKLKVESYN